MRATLKYCLLTTFLGVLLLVGTFSTLWAQDAPSTRFQLRVSYGQVNTLHYSQPITTRLCFEGCSPDEQRGQWAPSLEVSLGYAVGKRHQLQLGYGYHEIRYEEEGFASIGGFERFPYALEEQYQYHSILLGHRFLLKAWKKYRLYFTNQLLLQGHNEGGTFFLKSWGLSYQGKVEGAYALTPHLSLSLAGVFRTAINSYSTDAFRDFSARYRPYGVGAELGIALDLIPKKQK